MHLHVLEKGLVFQRIGAHVFQDILDQTVNLPLAMELIQHHQQFVTEEVLVFSKTLAAARQVLDRCVKHHCVMVLLAPTRMYVLEEEFANHLINVNVIQVTVENSVRSLPVLESIQHSPIYVLETVIVFQRTLANANYFIAVIIANLQLAISSTRPLLKFAQEEVTAPNSIYVPARVDILGLSVMYHFVTLLLEQIKQFVVVEVIAWIKIGANARLVILESGVK